MLTQSQATKWIYCFMLVHFLFWALIPAIIRNNLPLDAIEGTIWGHNLQWGYDKNPFLNGWLTAFAIYLDGYKGWMIYIFSQISVVVCLWSVWELAKRILNPVSALISVMALEAIQYYNFHAIDFNDNTLELGLWSLTIYYLYRALAPNRTINHTRTTQIYLWVAVGLFSALGMMAKYYTASLLAAMAIFIFTEASARQQLKSIPPYVGLLCFMAVISPHIYWLFNHEFITIEYVFERTSNPPNWTNHIFNPLEFTWQQFEAFLPAFILLVSLSFKPSRLYKPTQFKSPELKRHQHTFKEDLTYQSIIAPQMNATPYYVNDSNAIHTFNQRFIWTVGLGPFLLTLMLSILFGIKLRAGWGMPLQSLWGILLISVLQPTITKKKLYYYVAIIYSMIVAFIACYILSLVKSPDPSSANFPGQAIADSITKTWHDTYHTPLKYVAGSRWIGGNIEFYSSDHPTVYIEWDHQRAPWININDLKKQGGVFVWNLTDHEAMPDEVKRQFKTLQPPTILQFDWQRNYYHLAPTKIAVAFLAPSNSINASFTG